MLTFALQNILSRPVRSALAVIGMTVAIMGMVGLFSIAEGLDRVIGNTLQRVPGLVAMQRGAPIPLFSTLPRSWAEELESIQGVRAVSPECWARANVIEGEVIVSPPRLLCGSDIIRRNQLNIGIYKEDVTEGKYLDDDDVGTLNCVISRQIAEDHDKKVGDHLEVNGTVLTIIGIYHTGSILLDVAIIMDDDRFREMTRFDAETVSSYYIEQDGSVPDDILLARIDEKFRGRGPKPWQGTSLLSTTENPVKAIWNGIDRSLKRLAKQNSEDRSVAEQEAASFDDRVQGTTRDREARVDDNPLEVRLASDWAGRADKFAEDLDLALMLLTSLGIFIAVVSIINTMLMSVSERVSEFGILRANGWSKWDLVKLIAWESLVLGIAGGVLGCIVGWIGTLIVNASFPAKFELYASPSLLLYSLLFSALLGGLSGLYPAYWAASLNPMDAIRRN